MQLAKVTCANPQCGWVFEAVVEPKVANAFCPRCKTTFALGAGNGATPCTSDPAGELIGETAPTGGNPAPPQDGSSGQSKPVQPMDFGMGQSEIKGWTQLVERIRRMKQSSPEGPGPSETELARSLHSAFPFEYLFLAFHETHLRDPSYFGGLPFSCVTEEVVRRARAYMDSPKLSALMRVPGWRAPSDRYYSIRGSTAARDNALTDSLILGVVDCLRGRNYRRDDDDMIGRLAFEAIRQYSDIPIVNYFFWLPSIEALIIDFCISNVLMTCHSQAGRSDSWMQARR